jgi:hypothetical protein
MRLHVRPPRRIEDRRMIVLIEKIEKRVETDSQLVGWAKRSVPTIPSRVLMVGTALARLCPPYFFTIRRQCSHAARIKFSLASGVRNAECADSVTLSSFVSG